ncbi:unnamed protein product [Ceutorhynchus assimilis]|uniref:AAA+ ATPase domain-containing protein n=1 Tax=Ceutorhynchus assimilis TaxID=467358 RepID=A0A9N9N073_9CUCU|nr:unnamed protein product [Ceutorhynchus assimilis]
MSDFPDPDEEFELMYGDELELLREQDQNDDEVISPAPKARRSLNFGTPTTIQLDNSIAENLPNSLDSSLISQSQEIQSTLDRLPSKKRTIDDLFGDINDITQEEYNIDEILQPKKAKRDNKHQQDLDLIDLIIQKRQEYKINNNITATVSISHSNNLLNHERDKHNLSYSLPKYPFIKIKCFDGEFVYVRCHSEQFEKEETKRILHENTFKGILGGSFRKIWNEAQDLLVKEFIKVDQSSEELNIISSNNQEKQLWVDLYKPRKYLELLSDESTNRVMLRWMKLWDKVVFNRNPKIKITPAGQDDKYKFVRFNELNTTLDKDGRPAHKVVLLCGPPGLGKTTLAHMVARHAGYNVVEINASDDRSTEAFRTSLENATQMRSVIDQQKRPNCIVFDEIDGAPKTSIEFLVKFISGNVVVKAKKGTKPQTILKRPIICICNDAYGPALRPLRQIAFVINFPQTSSSRLAERLMEIARRQQIKTDTSTMMLLSEKSNNDIRSCLSVLHFFKAQNKPIGLIDIYKTNVGQKDMQKGLFSVWNEIFQLQRTKKPQGGTQAATMKDRMQNILNTMSSFGDHEKVAQGVYENFGQPDSKIKQDLVGTCCALDWFCFNDLVQKQIYTVQNYSLTGYLNFAFAIWHFAFAQPQKVQLKYPSASYEFRTKQTHQKGIVAEVLRGMPPYIRCYNAALPLVLDVLPLVLRIISPALRPVNLHLYTQEERANLLEAASIMADYNLNYIQERRTDGVYEFNLGKRVF